MRSLVGILLSIFLSGTANPLYSEELACKYREGGSPQTFSRPQLDESAFNFDALEPICTNRPEGYDGWALRVVSDDFGDGFVVRNLSVGMRVFGAVLEESGHVETDPGMILLQISRLSPGDTLTLSCAPTASIQCQATITGGQPLLSLDYTPGNAVGHYLEFFLNLDYEREQAFLSGGPDGADLFWNGIYNGTSLVIGLSYARLIAGYAITRVALHGECSTELVDAPLNSSVYQAVVNGFGHFRRWEFVDSTVSGVIRVPPGLSAPFMRLNDFQLSADEIGRLEDVVGRLECDSPEMRQIERNMIEFIQTDYSWWLRG